ncbi:Uncharacterised protein [Catenibacterium mitsuokai]|nr:Uncharacterised protein [Catenibacterium mitsuokai]
MQVFFILKNMLLACDKIAYSMQKVLNYRKGGNHYGKNRKCVCTC